MASNAPFAHLDATAQAELVRSGEVKPSELLEASIDRIEELNPRLNAVIHPLFESARDLASSERIPDGPFAGVPFLVKDAVCQTTGDPYHLGTQFLKDADYRAEIDSELARRYRAAGFVFVGRSNTPEFATSVTTEPRSYGATHNPWSLDHSPGGSSGGAGAAVASGMVPVAHGNDMGGSIRMPASACGLVGLKPTRGRNSLAPSFGEFWGPLTHEHVLARSVRDTAAVLDATAGRAVGDPYNAPPPAQAWRSQVGVDPGRLRIGFRTALAPGHAAGVACVEAVSKAAELLEALGHEVEEVALPAFDDPRFSHGLGVVISTTVATEVDRWSSRLGRAIELSELEPANALFGRLGRGHSSSDYVQGVDDLHSYARQLMAWWADGWDVLVTPTLGEAPAKLGVLGPDAPLDQQLSGATTMSAFTAPFNATGQPAISLPLHRSEDGLPIGVQFVADYAREDVLIRLASQLEAALPWGWPEL